MGLPVEVNNLMMGSLGGYNINRSLRFRNSATAYLNRTFAAAGNQQRFTMSFWLKRGSFGGLALNSSGWSGSGATQGGGFVYFANGDQLVVNQQTNNANDWNLQTTQVFRDPSAWYHFVIAVDTTQATAANRVLLYVNGAQITAFSSATYPTLNLNTKFNATNQRIASSDNGGATYITLDGYLAEYNFIDGQQLTPSSFGAYDTNGVWQPKKYTGTYGTNGFYLPFSFGTSSTYQGSFNGTNQSLSIANNSAFNLGSSNFTVEAWLYRTGGGGATSSNVLNQSVGGAASNSSFFLGAGNDGIALYLSTSGTSWTNFIQSSVGLNTNQWYHVVWQRRANTLEVYLNGVLQTSAAFTGTVFNSTRALEIGTQNGGAYFNGTISNLRMVTGSAVYNGNFVPSSSPLTAISGTQLLTLQNSSIVDNSSNAFSITNNNSVATSTANPFVSNISADASGNANNWLSNNISLVNGTTYDSMIDSPTVSASASNYATLNPIGKSGGTVTDGNLQWASSGVDGAQVSSTIALLPNTGKFYCEITIGSKTTIYWIVGFVESRAVVWSGTSAIYYGQSPYQAISQGDIIGITIDTSNGAYQFYRNNSSTNMPSGTITLTGQPKYFGAVEDSSGGTANYTFNFGQRPFTYTPPTGFNALNTYNLPAPSIANGAQYFSASIWSGADTGTGRSITNGGNNTLGTTFAPDLWWTKTRNNASYYHQLFDSVRGAGSGKALASNDTGAEGIGNGATYGYLSSFDSSGVTFTRGSAGSGANPDGYAYYDESGASYVGWNWKKSAISGFDIHTYTGNGSSVSAAHSLGVAPSFVITKSRNAAQNWVVYHKSVGTSNYLRLNTIDSQIAYGGFINPTSTQVFYGGLSELNTNGNTYVSYLFSEVSGYSAFGSYTGNGSADGPFIYTGFRPRFILMKSSSHNAHWTMMDSSRSTYNVAKENLFPNLTSAENTSNGDFDFLSNGFKPRSVVLNETNGSGMTYIYAAFAEHPFKYSRAR